MAMIFENFLLIDSNNEFSREFIEYQNSQYPETPAQFIVAGENTRHLIKLMFDNLIKDYCYCDFANEISVTELATYLLEHHQVSGIVIHDLDYHLACDAQKFIFNSLHPIRYLVELTPEGYNFKQLTDKANGNHLSCHHENFNDEDKNLHQSLSQLEND